MKNGIRTLAAKLEKSLGTAVCEKDNAGLSEAMRYSLLNGGKRIRGCLTLLFCALHGGDENAALPLACAIEAVHAHSLVHDDLPCMDDDDMRRGKPSCHVSFGEATALLAGDALLCRAFGIIAEADSLNSEQKLRAIRVLSKQTGEDGMLYGQMLDKLYETKTADGDVLNAIQDKKTGALIFAACELGCIAAEQYGENHIANAKSYAAGLGRAFQIRDDILDVTSTNEILGKPTGSDETKNKSTYVALLGLEASKQKVNELTLQAENAVKSYGEAADDLIALARRLTERKN